MEDKRRRFVKIATVEYDIYVKIAIVEYDFMKTPHSSEYVDYICGKCLQYVNNRQNASEENQLAAHAQ